MRLRSQRTPRWAEAGLVLGLTVALACGARGQLPEDAFAVGREAMVRDQLEAHGIADEATLKAMRTVPRQEFVTFALRPFAYADRPLPIGHGQTISQPYIVAFMTEAVAPRPGQTILEIGTGSGYQAAVLAAAGAEVYTVEIVPALARQASTTLRRLGFKNVHVRCGDGYRGWPEHAPYDAVLVTCAPDNIPPDLVTQLREGGRMAIPVGRGDRQDLLVLQKKDGRMEQLALLPVLFVPMTGEAERAR